MIRAGGVKKGHKYNRKIDRPGNRIGRCGSLEERFWKYVAIIPFHTCWEWIGSRQSFGKSKNGYGVLNSKELGMVRAHRYSYELHNGEIKDGMNVLHKCDNPGCVNPSHLYLGTQSENVKDLWDRNRRSRNKSESLCL